MGIDSGDYDHSGHQSLLIGNFSNQMLALYHNEAGELFIDQAPSTEVGQKSLLSLAFGVCFADYDNDGWLDLVVANGHVEDDIQKVQKQVTYQQRPLVFHNEGGGRFREVGESLGEALKRQIVARGLAYADYDLDGDLDLLITTNGGSAYLLRNDGGNKNNWLRINLQGERSNRSAIGAVLRAAAGKEVQTHMIRSGSSYCSQSELPWTIGLGSATKLDSLDITWPDGAKQLLRDLRANQILSLKPSAGASPPVAQQPR